MRVVITGASGVLGRHLMFEFIKQHAPDLGRLQLVVMGRANAHLGLSERIRRIILTDGRAYLSGSGLDARDLEKYCDERLTCVETDLNRDRLGLRLADVRLLQRAPIDYLFHSAALTDLRRTRVAGGALQRTNLHGTRRLLALCSELELGELCYVGSAYCCGRAAGRIMPDFVRTDGAFRNPYERTKLAAEVEVRRLAERTDTRCRYFRPSIICGRLIEPPTGSISKFGVFYALAAFLVRRRMHLLDGQASDYRRSVDLNLRVCCDPRSSLNIVPADYAAKVMVQVCVQQDPGESYHVVNATETPNRLLIALMPHVLAVRGLRIVEAPPEDPSRLEALYYKTVGSQFSQYALSEPMHFDTANLAGVLDRAGLQCPPIDGPNFMALMDFAKRRAFGLPDPAGPRRSARPSAVAAE